MRKQAYLLTVLLAIMPILLQAQDDSKYLAGAVPEEDGKIVFRKEFDLPGASQDAIYDRIYTWMEERLKQNANNSRIAYSDEEKGVIAGVGEEYIVFKSSALSLDRTLVDYQLSAFASPGNLKLEVERIRYTYGEEKPTAEEYISDKNALNKSKTKLVRGLAKFRTKTVDFVDDLFASAQAALGIAQAPAVVQQQPVVAAPLVTAQPVTTQPIVNTEPTISAPSVQQTPVTVVGVPRVNPSTPVTSLSPEVLDGYRQISADKIPGNIIKMLGENWMLITAGNKEHFNMMTASWGGIGRLYEKPVAFCFINPTRYTYQLMEKNDTYTLTFYTEAYRDALQFNGTNSGRNTDKVKGSGLTPVTTPQGSQAFTEAWMIIECRKLVSQSLTPEAVSDDKIKEEYAGKQLHKMYIGEIINVWVK